MLSTDTIPARLAPDAGTKLKEPTRRGLARVGGWAASHLLAVLVLWLLVLAVFGAFAPKVASALSGAGIRAEP